MTYKCRIRLFNLTIDIFRVICPNKKFRYDSNRMSITKRDRFSQEWRNSFLLSGKLGYDHKKSFQNMTIDETSPKSLKVKLDKYNADEDR